MAAAGDLRAGAHLDVANRAGLAAHHDKVAQFGGPGNAGLADNHAMPADHHVVPDLHEIINFAALADDGVLERPAIDAAIGADFHVIVQNDAADLGDLEVALRPHGKAKAVLADAHARVQNDAVADDGVRHADPRSDVAALADHDAVADEGTGGHRRGATDLGFAPDHGAGLHQRTGGDPRARVHQRLTGGGHRRLGL